MCWYLIRFDFVKLWGKRVLNPFLPKLASCMELWGIEFFETCLIKSVFFSQHNAGVSGCIKKRLSNFLFHFETPTLFLLCDVFYNEYEVGWV